MGPTVHPTTLSCGGVPGPGNREQAVRADKQERPVRNGPRAGAQS